MVILTILTISNRTTFKFREHLANIIVAILENHHGCNQQLRDRVVCTRQFDLKRIGFTYT